MTATTEPIEAAEHIDPVRYAEVQLTDGQAVELSRDVAANLTAKVDAGARLFYALYHHPKAKELFGSEFMTMGLQKAYISARDAYMPDRRT